MSDGERLQDDGAMASEGHAKPWLIGGGVGIGGFAFGVLIAWCAVPLAANAQAADASDAPKRTINLTVYGDDPCPKGSDGEIVVCAHQPESERYRVPKRFRGQKAAASPASKAWGSKVQATEQASRTAAGLPDTCSAVGSGGQSGCQHQFLSQARAQRAEDKAEAAGTP
jgi:hypothetical protein